MSYVLEGPQFGVLAWIPRKDFPRGGAGVFHDCVRNEENWWQLNRIRIYWGCKYLFVSGNEPPPPLAFAGFDEFAAFLRGQNYRSTLCFSRVRLQCSDSGIVEDVDWDILEESNVGYTPYRAGNLINYSQGDGFPSEVSETRAMDHVTLAQSVFFRIGGVGRLLGMATTNYFPPYAWLTLTYEIYAQGHVTAHVSGSHIPNRSYYVGWSRIQTENMEKSSPADIIGFLRAKKRAIAPPGIYYAVSARALRKPGVL